MLFAADPSSQLLDVVYHLIGRIGRGRHGVANGGDGQRGRVPERRLISRRNGRRRWARSAGSRCGSQFRRKRRWWMVRDGIERRIKESGKRRRKRWMRLLGLRIHRLFFFLAHCVTRSRRNKKRKKNNKNEVSFLVDRGQRTARGWMRAITVRSLSGKNEQTTRLRIHQDEKK